MKTKTPPMPKAVKTALLHVRSHFPRVSMVVFNSNERWQYLDEDFDAPFFRDKVDTAILEAAMDSVKTLPAVFELRPDAGWDFE